jgi:hypothetical protein
LGELIAARLKDKIAGISDDKIGKLVEGYRVKFAGLSGRDVTMPDEVRDQLIKAMDLLPEEHDSTMAVRIAEKLAAVTESSEELAAL